MAEEVHIMKLRGAIYIALVAMILLPLSRAASASLIGSPAPDFTADSTEGTLTLSELQGKKNVILAFYFADFTPV